MKKVLAIFVLSAVLHVGCTNIEAVNNEDCHRGTLDTRYCDRDHDFVADPPLDSKDWVNPDTLIFSYTPVERPKTYAKTWEGFLQHLAKVTGKKVKFLPVKSYREQYVAMRDGRLHIAGVNSGGNPFAVSCSGMVPFAMMASKDGSYGYQMVIIVPEGSDIKFPLHLKGRTLALTSPTSNSGSKAPTTLLKLEFGLVRDRDFKTVFSGSHANSVVGVANKMYDAAAVASNVLDRMIDRKAIDPATVTSIYQSITFPPTGYGYAHSLHPALAAKIKQAFFTFKWEGSELKREFKNEDGFIPVDYKLHWKIIRKVDAYNRVTYDCNNI